MHDTGSFHASQLLSQHLLRDGGNGAFKVGEAHDLATKRWKRMTSFHLPSSRRSAASTSAAAEMGCIASASFLLTYFLVRTSYYLSAVPGFSICEQGGCRK